MATAATTGLRFCLLGPLEVLRDGEPLALGGERQRGLLALLLLHANELVPTEHLAEQLFGADASDASIRAVRVAVSRLRRLLDDETLETGPGGYLARADPAQLDVASFRALVTEGRAALAGGDPAAAAASFRAALALFRGPPLADLAPLDFVQPEIRRLEELRLSAVMDRIDADLALGSGGELVPELETLVQANQFQERLRGQLMLALYRSGRQADALEIYRRTREVLADELGLEPSRALQQLERAMLQQDPTLDVGAVAAPAEAATCPFKGLAAFEAADAFYFCGRERLLDEIVTRLASETFLGIVGPSGVGKSSLLRAGVLPALAAGALPGSATWRVVLVRGGDRAATIVRDAVGACQVGERVVIAVDQLEEIFADDVPAAERVAFFEELEGAATDPANRALVLVAVRADFYGRFADHPRIADRLSQSHVFARSLDREELARAIEVPASRAGLDIERPLVDALVDETAGIAGALPLLQTTLLQLWAARDGRALRHKSYRAIGGLRGAVARLAEETFARLSPQDQALTRRIMLRLAGGEEGALVRRRVPLADLQRLGGAARVVDALVTARLLTVDDDFLELSHEALLHEWPRYAQWLEDDRVSRRVRGHLTASADEWDSRGRDNADLYRGARLTAALELPAVELSDLEKEFLDASRAEAERELNQQRTHNRRLRTLLVGVGVLLVAAVIAGVLALASRSNAQREAQIALGRQLGAEAVSQPRIDLAMLLARESLNLDRSPQTEGTLLATLLRSPAAVATYTIPMGSRPCCAISLSPNGSILGIPDNNNHLRLVDPQKRRTLHVFDNAGFLSPPAFTADGSRLAFFTGPKPGVAVLDSRTLTVVRRLPFDHRWLTKPTTNPNLTLFFTPDGRQLFFVYQLVPPAGNGAYVDRWDIGSGHVTTRAVGADGALAGALVEGGREFAVVSNSAVTFFDTKNMRIRRRVSVSRPQSASQAVGSTAVSPDGRTLVVGSQNGSLSFIDLRDGRSSLGRGGHSAPVDGVMYSPNGRRLVSTAEDGSVIVWNARTKTPVERLYGHAARVLGGAFSPDGRTLFTSSLDGAVFEWDLGTSTRFGQPFSFPHLISDPATLSPATPPAPLLSVSTNGGLFAASASQSRVEIYSTQSLHRVGRVSLAPSRNVGAGTWAGRRFVLGADRGLVQFWNAGGRKPQPEAMLHGLSSRAMVRSLASADGGRVIAAVDGWYGTPPKNEGPPEEGELAIWRDGRLVSAPLKLHTFGDAVALSTDGSTAAATTEDARVLIVNTRTGKLERTIRPQNAAGSLPSVAFSPDGTLATGSWSGIVDLWNPRTGTEVGHPTLVAGAPVAAISFSPDGKTFATSGGSSGSARIWVTATQQQLGSDFPGGAGQWGNVAYSPDGRYLFAVYGDGTADRWPVSLSVWEHHACAVAGRNLTSEEWARFVGGRSYSRVCP